MSNKICPVCETSNEPGAKHCEVCGERLVIASVAAGAQDGLLSLDAQVDAAAEVLPSPLDELPSESMPTQLAALDEFNQRIDTVENGFDRDEKTIIDALPPLQDSTSPTLTAFREEAPAVAPMRTARIVVYQNKAPAHSHAIVHDETLIGRSDPTSDAYPDLDLAFFNGSGEVSRKHAFLYREGGRFFLRPISNTGTQVGKTLVEIGQRQELSPGDVIILGGAIAMKFEL